MGFRHLSFRYKLRHLRMMTGLIPLCLVTVVWLLLVLWTFGVDEMKRITEFLDS